MNKIQKYFEELSNISKKDLLAIFYNLLKDEKVSYVELSTIYTQYLQDKLANPYRLQDLINKAKNI